MRQRLLVCRGIVERARDRLERAQAEGGDEAGHSLPGAGQATTGENFLVQNFYRSLQDEGRRLFGAVGLLKGGPTENSPRTQRIDLSPHRRKYQRFRKPVVLQDRDLWTTRMRLDGHEYSQDETHLLPMGNVAFSETWLTLLNGLHGERSVIYESDVGD